MHTARMEKRLQWGILGAGGIANTFAKGLARSQQGRLVAIGSRDASKAADFAARHAPAVAHGSYEALLADPAVEAVYIATPHPQHLEWILKAAAAGKHILCEKPIAMNAAQAERAIQACAKAGVLLMEAFMYRCHPQTHKLVQVLRSGMIGEIRMVQATFSFNTPFDASSRFYNPELGGGGLLDVGCYTSSIARLIAGVSAGLPWADPEDLAATAVMHPETGVDILTAATLRFADGLIAQLSCGISVNQENVVRIYGSDGWLLVSDPFVVNVDGGVSRIQAYLASAKCPDMIRVESGPLYALEADAFASALARGLREVPEMSLSDTLGNMRTLDRWRQAIGLRYPME